MNLKVNHDAVDGKMPIRLGDEAPFTQVGPYFTRLNVRISSFSARSVFLDGLCSRWQRLDEKNTLASLGYRKIDREIPIFLVFVLPMIG